MYKQSPIIQIVGMHHTNCTIWFSLCSIPELSIGFTHKPFILFPSAVTKAPTNAASFDPGILGLPTKWPQIPLARPSLLKLASQSGKILTTRGGEGSTCTYGRPTKKESSPLIFTQCPSAQVDSSLVLSAVVLDWSASSSQFFLLSEQPETQRKGELKYPCSQNFSPVWQCESYVWCAI